MTIRRNALLSILALSLLYASSAHAEDAAKPSTPPAETTSRTAGTDPAAGTVQAAPDAQTIQPSQTIPAPISIYLDGSLLQTEAEPVNVNGTLLVPMRRLFEGQGAKLSWNNTDKTVTATKDGTTLTYRIGDLSATVNDRIVELNVPGQISGGYTMVPLRFISEALGSTVTWDQAARSVQISTMTFETTIRWGVNLCSSPDSGSGPADGAAPSLKLVSRSADVGVRSPASAPSSPDTGGGADILGLLPTGSKVHVVREVDAFWLEVRTPDNQTGYISAKPKYTDYTSPSLTDKQTDELIAYGETFLGTPYVFGASPDQTGSFDCSSFVKRVFQDTLAVDLPRVSYDQAKTGTEIGLDELRKGDLLFFSARDLNIGHVAIYAGDNQLLHTYSVKYGVRTEAFSDYWKKRFVTARRVF
ncbi:stalk domain-containing protein [Paenibacillus zanthoxyli]|uniref:stalk domain-containing protein n=1 Tax=Paenibacillus zanthoxyli TaxID=369399 RepID=UPI00046F105B|nr:stalk domain-containing protein [Paenibacillus zanthoxyli]